MQIKRIRHQTTLLSMAIIKGIEDKSIGVNMEKVENLYIVDENVKWYSCNRT